MGKDAGGQRRVDESSEGRKKGIETLHKNRGRYGTKLAGMGPSWQVWDQVGRYGTKLAGMGLTSGWNS